MEKMDMLESIKKN